MSLTLRTITNVGSPLYDIDGSLLVNVPVTFILVDNVNNTVDTFDIETEERITGFTTVVTDQNGEFSASLWPNDRGEMPTRYLCRVPNCIDFSASLTHSTLPISWLEFKTSGRPLSALEISVLDKHITDSDVHLTPTQNALLDNLTATYTELNRVVGVTSSIQGQLNDITSTTVNGHTLTGNITVTKSDVGLGNVDNTSDINKPVSTAQAAADSAVLSAAAIDATNKANAADKNFIFYQNSPTSIWNIVHTLAKYPSVTIIDSGGTQVEGDIDFINSTTLQIAFTNAFSGRAILN